ncbi:MAG: putative glycoside hydrolase [Candidatus Komeilibacteria bacterium]|nr:putative glycoside hydrolase [Candidatus Komeilibacteria bacterium]
MSRLSKIIIIIVTLLSAIPIGADAFDHSNPRLANYYLRWQITEHEAVALAKWDLLILDMQNQFTSLSALRKIRESNPDIKILAYLTAQEVQTQHSKTTAANPWRQIYDQVNNHDLWLYDRGGKRISFWPGTNMIDVTQTEWQEWLPTFLVENILQDEAWDGVFLDNSFGGVDHLGDTSITDQEWQTAMRQLISGLRARLASDQVIVVNSSSVYADTTQGRLYEGWPQVYGGNWRTNMIDALALREASLYPKTMILNTNTGNQYTPANYKLMRYGLSSALLLDAYFSFDYGDQNHAQTWWYDEYDLYLGKPLGEASNLAGSLNDYGIWRRDFDDGIVLLNSTSQDQRIKLDGEYEKIKGTQDKIVNNGRLVTSIDLPAQDGIIMRRRIDSLADTTFRNGSFARIYTATGELERNGFFAFDKTTVGGLKVAITDLDGDGLRERLVAGDNWIEIYDSSGVLKKKFYPYTERYNQGINFVIGDLNGDGWSEIITGTERGGGPQIRIFNSEGVLINPGFFAYATNFRGGVSVAVADLSGNGQMEVIAGAGYGGGPHVRIFDQKGKLLSPGFMAFASTFRGGVTVAGGDLDGDGRAEIVATPGRGGKAEITVFDERGRQLSNWLVHPGNNNQGLGVAAIDITGNGRAEIITTATDVFTWQ